MHPLVKKSCVDISVIIPAFNRASLIGETLRSILNQTVSAKEIIVVDDGSQDGTSDAVLEILKLGEAEKLKISDGKPWPQVRVIRQENAGPGVARNRGLAESTGEFIHFFDSDDIAAPKKHEVQLRALLETGADIAYGPWVKGRFAPPMADSGLLIAEGGGAVLDSRLSTLDASSARDAGRWSLVSGPWSFTPEGPVLQAMGLPEGDLVQALLTNWSVVPHACLFRRSILEKAGGFPEDIWVGEDQWLFLRCLLAGARVVHTSGTMVYYRLGDDPGKLTATGAAQKRHARDWARFLVKANQEVKEKAETLKSEVVKAPATSYSLPATTTPSSWFGFRLRAYEGWRDLRKFFPHGEDELKSELKRIWKRNQFSGLRFQVLGFVFRKLGGLKFRIMGYREHASFRCSKFSIFVAEGCLADFKT
jgi:glycosyltransferase involved in cell wall biosynthesis